MPRMSAQKLMVVIGVFLMMLVPWVAWKWCRGSVRMIRAVRAGDLVKVEKLLSANPKLLNARDDRQRAGIVQWAVVSDQPAMLDFLIERGADIYTGNRHDVTPLHSAAIFNRADMVHLLLSRGADPYHMIFGYGAIYLTPLHKAAEAGSFDAVKVLLDDGVDVNVLTKGSNRVTPLHIAAARGHQSVVRLLVERGAEINCRDITGATPLSWALHMEKYETIDLLRLLGGRE